jgi:peptidyl-prolyl cis-trans isomerase D
MLSFIRRLTHSKLGIIITMGVLIVIALAFAAGDITGTRAKNPGATSGDELASVGGTAIGEAELRNRTQIAFASFRQQQPTLDIATFVNSGGYQQVLDRTINGLALQEFAGTIGMAMSKQAVDGEIASIPAFQGVDGKFNQATYESVLQQQRLTDKQVRDDIVRDTLSRQLVAPTLGAAQVPAQLALPYASLLLEKRQGVVGFIPVTATANGPAPTDAEIAAWYQRQRARYLVPERRSMRYAIVKAADIKAAAKPTDADIVTAYKAAGRRFAATEKRTLSQVIILDQNLANALAAKVKGGTPIADAARAAGLSPNVLTNVEKADFATASSPAAANAAFAAAPGAVIGPIKTPLGFAVLRVDGVQQVPGKTLAQATPELMTEVVNAKAAEALAKLQADLDDAIGGNATFDEVIADAKLTPLTSRPLLASGIDPDAPGAAPDPLLTALIPAAFAAEPGDSPQLVPTAADGSFAIVGIGKVVPAAPRPLAQIRDVVVKDIVTDRAMTAARAAAAAAVAKIDKGMTFAQAMRETGLKLPPQQPLNASRAQLASQRGNLPPPLALMFSMAPKRAKLLEAPNRGGWFVVYLDAIQSGNAAGNAQLIASTRQGLGSVSGRELVEQFSAAVRNQVGVKRNDAAIARLRDALAGAATSANP